MATKGQELKKELTQAFSGLKFSVKTKMVCKGNITEIAVTVKGLKDTNYTVAEIKEITNKYHNWDWRTVTGDTNVVVNTDEEIKEVIDNPVVETVEVTKKETTNSPVVETVKEVKPKNKIAKLQTKLIRLESQLKITKGNRAKAKIVIEILKVESTIERLEPSQEVLGDLVIYKGMNNTYQVTDIKSGFSTIYEANSPIGKLLHLRSFIQKAKRQDTVNSVKRSA